jgi:thiol-disulfide isomerase/thioredoxin
MQTIKKHSTLFIILGIIAVVVAAMLYVLLQPQQASTPSDNANTGSGEQAGDSTEPANNGTVTEPSTATPGRYEDYNEAAFNQTEGRRVLFFHAPWCPQCRALDASIKAGTVPSGVTIFKTDYDSNQELRQKYGVTIQTTLVEVDENGNEVKKYVAYDEPTFDAVMAAMNL